MLPLLNGNYHLAVSLSKWFVSVEKTILLFLIIIIFIYIVYSFSFNRGEISNEGIVSVMPNNPESINNKATYKINNEHEKRLELIANEIIY